MIWFVLAVTVIAVGFDLWKREIPDSLSLVLIVAGIVSWWLPGDEPWSRRAFFGMLGAALAASLTVTLYWLDGLGGGDVKLLTAIGLCVGLGIGAILLWTALAGALLAGVASWRQQRHYAYAPAILLGVVTHALFPGLLARIAQSC
jgi:Flp pilus assembly protein protease CpaA